MFCSYGQIEDACLIWAPFHICENGTAARQEEKGHGEKEEIDGVLLDTMLARLSQNKHSPMDLNAMMSITPLIRKVFYE